MSELSKFQFCLSREPVSVFVGFTEWDEGLIVSTNSLELTAQLSELFGLSAAEWEKEKKLRDDFTFCAYPRHEKGGLISARRLCEELRPPHGGSVAETLSAKEWCAYLPRPTSALEPEEDLPMPRFTLTARSPQSQVI